MHRVEGEARMIDESAKTALLAVSPEVLGGQAEPWFDAVITAVQEDGSVLGWDDFLRRLKDSGSSFGQAVDLFEQGMRDDSSAWPNIAQQLINEGASQLASQYEQVWAEQLAEPGADDEVDVTAAWEGLVAESGDWSAWDGSDAGWTQWRDWFYSVAATHGDTVEAAAREQLDWMDGLPLAEKVAALTERGFTVSVEEAEERDPAEVWAELVAEGGDWSAWDGSDDGWAQWRDWFYSVAATRFGDDVEATAHEQLDWMDALPVAEKIAALRERGFTVIDPEQDETADADAGAAAAVDLAPDITQVVTDNVAPQDEQQVLDLLSEFKAAGLTDEQIKEALAEAS
jgi:hypothetical protein